MFLAIFYTDNLARLAIICLIWTLVGLLGCSDNVQMPTQQELARFYQAQPPGLSTDMEEPSRILPSLGPYRVQPDDILEIRLSAFLGATVAERPLPQDQVNTVICRISQAGTITLPIIGQVYVTGKTLSQIEAIVATAYYPAYSRTYPTVLVTLRQASTHNVSIVGSVARPGIYELRSDQMSLISLLTEAGGIVQSGAMCIRIVEAEAGSKSKTIVLPIKGLNIPVSDVALQDGDHVIVERLVVPFFTVIGLVARPGNFEYPPGASYNLIQAIAFAGGLDPKLEPRYAMIYRLDADGSIVYAMFQLADPKHRSAIADAAGVQIKPGDIIAVEHTPRTRSREFLWRIFNVQMGAYLPLVR